MRIEILGTDYEIIKKRYDDEEAFKRSAIDGYCDGYAHKIVYCDMTTHKDWEHEGADTLAACEKAIIRHEIVYAFYNERGLTNSAFAYDDAWTKNEEMIDWIAAQGPKLYAAWQAAGAI